MASLASAARDIPKAASLNRDNLAVVADRSGLATVAPSHSLPTPPNSISPALPAHGLKAQLRKASLEPVDSDLDLRDNAPSRSRLPSPAAHEASGAITSAMLAKYHLPEILLNHGPLAIRHIMGYLTTSVPGFSGIPPTKARRVVVGALEGRGGGERWGSQGDVDFEKVGWGRWNARRRGSLSARDRQGTPPASSGVAIPISRIGTRSLERARPHVSGSVGEGSVHFSHDDHDLHLLESEADKMSMDSSASAFCSEAPEDDVAMNDDPEDATDDEDWAAVGAAALRAESYHDVAAARSDGNTRFDFISGGLRSFSATSGMARPPAQPAGLDLSALAAASDAQEREAVEALLRLGSV